MSQDKFNLDFVEISRFDDEILNQIKMMFAFKSNFTLDQRITIEKMIKTKDF